MKRIAGLMLMVLIVSISGFARNADSANVHFATSTRVGSNDLPAGDYRMTWTDSGPEAQVSFVQGKKVIATVPAKLAPADNSMVVAHAGNGMEIDTAQEGSATILEEIHLEHLNLLFSRETTAQR
jgi:hypothetical protein